MCGANIIKHATAGWASHVVIVHKNDGSYRMRIDYGKLNAVTIRDTYPFPKTEERSDSLGEAVVFSTLGTN